MTKELQAICDKFGGCSVAWEWVESSGLTTIAEVWEACPRGDWMLWMLAKTNYCTRQQLVLAACKCARLVLHLVPKGEARPRIAIETAEAWARGEATLRDVKKAADADSAAAYAAEAAAAAYAAEAAAAAYAAEAAAAAYAAEAAAAAAYDAEADADTARAETLLKCADIVRPLYTGETQ